MEKQVKIGPQIFDIVFEEDLHRGEEGLDGWIRFYSSTISLDKRLNEFSQRQVLWHEIIHAIFTIAGIKDLPDSAVDAIAYGVLGVLQDNEWLGKNA
jgi:hypothetical protein